MTIRVTVWGENVHEHTNAVVAGVPVGGLSSADAERELTARLAGRAAAPIEVTVGGQRATIDPVQAGLRLDVAVSVARAGGGRSFDPRHIWRVLTGGTTTGAVTTADPAKLEAAVAALATDLDRPARDATVRSGPPSPLSSSSGSASVGSSVQGFFARVRRLEYTSRSATRLTKLVSDRPRIGSHWRRTRASSSKSARKTCWTKSFTSW